MKIYTKTGDQGSTSLIGGRRISKADAQVEVYGNLDELNSWIGVLASYQKVFGESDREMLGAIQENLFKIGSFYSFDFSIEKKFDLPFIDLLDIERLEEEIDTMQGKLPVLKDFILPGGVRTAAQTQVARCVCRRCEREMVKFSLGQTHWNSVCE
ncbi:MAG: cob(I)yrinic acid a,c-diamide adenosyltransferase, partial [Bacteroidales bacterium]